MGKVIALCGLLALASCASTGGTFCDIAHPIRPSAVTLAAMSDAEVTEALKQDLTGAELCGWSPN